MNKIILETKNLSKSYFQGGKELLIFKEVNFSLKQGEIIALLGASGSGKTSFLNILGMLDKASSGELYINQQNIANLSDEAKTKLRGQTIGFVFQFHHLLPDFTVIENVIIPQLINGVKKNTATVNAVNILSAVGLKDKLYQFPSNLSGGEQQRVALARAVVLKPKILIADEPTGNLDTETTKEIFALILDLLAKDNIAIILATHNIALADAIDKQISIVDKKIVLQKSSLLK